MLHHVSLEVSPQQADRFGELLAAIGLQRLAAPERLGDGVRWYGSAGTQVHLILTREPRAPALGHAAFVVSPFEETLATLRRLGFEVEEARRLWGERRAFVVAPGGHRIEVMAAPPPE